MVSGRRFSKQHRLPYQKQSEAVGGSSKSDAEVVGQILSEWIVANATVDITSVITSDLIALSVGPGRLLVRRLQSPRLSQASSMV